MPTTQANTHTHMTCAQYANTLYVLLQAEELIDQMDVQISEVEEEFILEHPPQLY